MSRFRSHFGSSPTAPSFWAGRWGLIVFAVWAPVWGRQRRASSRPSRACSAGPSGLTSPCRPFGGAAILWPPAEFLLPSVVGPRARCSLRLALWAADTSADTFVNWLHLHSDRHYPCTGAIALPLLRSLRIIISQSKICGSKFLLYQFVVYQFVQASVYVHCKGSTRVCGLTIG